MSPGLVVLRLLGEARDDVVVDALRGQHARRRGAVLTGVEVAGPGDRLHRELHVGVVEDDHRRLAAELQVDPLQGVRRVLGDPLAGRRRARQRDHVDLGMRHQRRARGIAMAADEVHDAGRIDLGRQLGQDLERRHRGGLGRLQDEGAAGGERGADLPDGHHQRVVPGGDLPHHAGRLATDVGGVVLHVLARGAPFHRPSGSGEEAELIHHRRDLLVEHRLPRLAGVPGLPVGDLLGPLLERVGELQQQLLALRRRRVLPGLERLARRLHGPVDVLLGGDGRVRDHLAGRGVDHVLGLALGRIDELAADHVLQVEDLGRILLLLAPRLRLPSLLLGQTFCLLPSTSSTGVCSTPTASATAG